MVTNGFWQGFTAELAERSAMGELVTLTARDTPAIIAAIIPERAGTLADETRRFLPAVLAEIAELDQARNRDQDAVTRRAIAFALATPRRMLVQSIHVGRHASAAWQTFETVAAGEAFLRALPHPSGDGRSYSAPMPAQLARSYHAAYPLFASPETVSVPALEAIHGVGPKVARMAMAVAHPHARIFTADVWHGRQLLALAGRPYRHDVSIAATAYPMVEEWFLAWADVHFPGIPAWAVQWAAWDAASGKHRPHRDIWAGI